MALAGELGTSLALQAGEQTVHGLDLGRCRYRAKVWGAKGLKVLVRKVIKGIGEQRDQGCVGYGTVMGLGRSPGWPLHCCKRPLPQNASEFCSKCLCWCAASPPSSPSVFQQCPWLLTGSSIGILLLFLPKGLWLLLSSWQVPTAAPVQGAARHR